MNKLFLIAALLLGSVVCAEGQATIQQTTASQNWYWNTTQPATLGTPQNSPILNLGSRYWSGADSGDTYAIQNICGTATNPSCLLTITHNGSSGVPVGIQSPAFIGSGTNPLISLSEGASPASLPATSVSLFPASTITTSYALGLPASYPTAAGPILVAGGASGSPLTAGLIFGSLSNPSGMEMQTASGTLTSGNLSSWNSSGDLVDSGVHGSGGFLQSSNTVRVTGTNFSVSNTTTLTAITGLAWTLPATAAAATYSFLCHLTWESGGATLAGLNLGLGISAAPTSIDATGDVTYASGATRSSTIRFVTNATTGAQSVVTSAAAAVTTTAYTVLLIGAIEGAPTGGSTFTIYAAPSTGTTTKIVITTGSFCQLF